MIVNDYCMKLKAPELRTGGASSNEFVSGANNEAGSVLVNSFGAGGAGAVVNAIGAGSTGSVVNAIGAGSSGSVLNDIGSGSTGLMTNSLGTAGSGSGMVYNLIGTDDGLNGGTTINRIGNINAATEVRATAATSSMVMIQGALDMASVDGQSILPGPLYAVDSGNSMIQKDASGKHLVYDENGRFTVVDGVADQLTNSVYLRNGYGDTNGLMLTETGATLTGGTTGGTALALTDQGVHFSHSDTGAPVRMSGIADGQEPFDAVNVRQLNGGIASVAALAGLPAPQLGKRSSFGMGFGVHDGGRANTLGGQSMFGDGMTFKYGVAVSESAGLYDSTASLGVGFSW